MMTASRGITLVLLMTAILAGCGPTASTTAPQTVRSGATPPFTGALTVFAASSLTDAFTEVGARLKATDPGMTIAFNFAASSALATQLAQGARADVFATADREQMERARRDGAIQGSERAFIRNQPVIVVPARNPGKIGEPRDIARAGVKLILAAPQVPIGSYSRQILDNMARDPAYGADFRRRAEANVVSHEANVRQVVAKVQLAEGDAGIVYASDVTPAVRNQLRIIPIPAHLNVIADYFIGTVAGAANEAGARTFIDYLLSPDGQAILVRWGFVPLERSGAGSTLPARAADQGGEAIVAPRRHPTARRTGGA